MKLKLTDQRLMTGSNIESTQHLDEVQALTVHWEPANTTLASDLDEAIGAGLFLSGQH